MDIKETVGKLMEDEKVQGVVKEVMDKAKNIDPKDIDPKDIKGTIEKIVSKDWFSPSGLSRFSGTVFLFG